MCRGTPAGNQCSRYLLKNLVYQIFELAPKGIIQYIKRELYIKTDYICDARWVSFLQPFLGKDEGEKGGEKMGLWRGNNDWGKTQTHGTDGARRVKGGGGRRERKKIDVMGWLQKLLTV